MLVSVALSYMRMFPSFLTARAPFECNATADIGFIVDSAGVTESEFSQQKQFVKSIADAFGSSSTRSRFGVMTSDKPSEKMMKLTDHATANDFKKSVDKLKTPQPDSIQMDKALKRAYKELLNPVNGARLDSPKVLVILSAAEKFGSVNTASLGKALGPLHEDGTKIIVVAVGRGSNNPHLRSLAREPSDVYVVKTFDDLVAEALKSKISNSACKSTGS